MPERDDRYELSHDELAQAGLFDLTDVMEARDDGWPEGTEWDLGDGVTVKLVEAAPVAGGLRFELLSEGRYDVAARRSRGKRDGRPQSKSRSKHRGR